MTRASARPLQNLRELPIRFNYLSRRAARTFRYVEARNILDWLCKRRYGVAHGIKGAAYPVDRISTLRTPIFVPQIPLSADSVEKGSAKFWRRTPCHLHHLSRATVRRLRALQAL